LAIPGSTTTKIEIRAKVRVGEKFTARSGKELPRSTDHFICDDPEVPDGCSDLVIELPHAEPDDAFRTGLEWWQGKVLACYSDEGGADPTAFRVSALKLKDKTLSYLDADDEVRGEPVGQGRTPIACRFRQCRHFGANADNQQCRVKGRLTFLIPGGRTDQALQFETKGWNTIEQISSTLAACRRSGPLNAPGRKFVLSVRMETKGTSKFPVVTITEDRLEVETAQDIPLADALVQLRRVVEEEGATDAEIKLRIAAALDITNAGWRESQEFIVAMQKRVEELGVVGAAKSYLSRYEA
jgi:hypothetical protein